MHAPTSDRCRGNARLLHLRQSHSRSLSARASGRSRDPRRRQRPCSSYHGMAPIQSNRWTPLQVRQACLSLLQLWGLQPWLYKQLRSQKTSACCLPIAKTSPGGLAMKGWGSLAPVAAQAFPAQGHAGHRKQTEPGRSGGSGGDVFVRQLREMEKRSLAHSLFLCSCLQPQLMSKCSSVGPTPDGAAGQAPRVCCAVGLRNGRPPTPNRVGGGLELEKEPAVNFFQLKIRILNS